MLNTLINDLDGGTESFLIKFAGEAKLGGVTCTLEQLSATFLLQQAGMAGLGSEVGWL